MFVKKVDLSKSKKSYRVFDGKNWYGASIDSGIEQMQGKAISADVQEGEFGPWLVNIKETNAPELAAGVAARATATDDRWWVPFVSNQVAHAIAAGLIKNPGDMAGWAKQAHKAITKANEGFKSADDDIDF